MLKKDAFYSPTNGKMQIDEMIANISSFIDEDKKTKHELVIGTDSNGTGETEFITAVIVRRIGKGGRFFWKKTKNSGIFHILRDRIYREVSISLKTAEEILNQLNKALKKQESQNINLQIHIDVGQNGKTKEMIKEVVGMVRGNGFEAKIKPESYGASNVADKYV